ncbi:MAG: ornithine cyclodeaminase family protein, partial [Methanomicrobiales archaeon]|nr:ornithine cyclodeaminase family protein [Methanomicrobiales archaeon]
GMAGVKIVNVHPRNPAIGLPTVMALTVILDIETGKPEAVINATRLTDMRTGAAGAVAAKYLSPRRRVTMGVIGSGRQAETQVLATAEELSIDELLVWSRTETHAREFARRFPQFNARSVSLQKACGADILATVTPATAPVVQSAWVADGTHINAIGADAPGKEELEPALLQRARVFVDDMAQAVHSGEVNVPIRMGVYAAQQIAGTLGEVILGKTGRKSPEEITIFDSTGLAITDLAIAALALAHAESVELPFP